MSKAQINKKALERYMPLMCVITLIILIDSLVMEFFSITIFSSIFFIIQLIAYYFIVGKEYVNPFQPLAMGFILSMSRLQPYQTVQYLMKKLIGFRIFLSCFQSITYSARKFLGTFCFGYRIQCFDSIFDSQITISISSPLRSSSVV